MLVKVEQIRQNVLREKKFISRDTVSADIKPYHINFHSNVLVWFYIGHFCYTFRPSKGAWFTMMEDRHHVCMSCIPPGFEFHSFQFFQKCLFLDLTLTSCLGKLKIKFEQQ